MKRDLFQNLVARPEVDTMTIKHDSSLESQGEHMSDELVASGTYVPNWEKCQRSMNFTGLLWKPQRPITISQMLYIEIVKNRRHALHVTKAESNNQVIERCKSSTHG